MVALSIVVPTYNSYHLMKHGLDLFKSMDMNQVEVVFVDDCSTDGTYDKLMAYKRSVGERIKVCQNKKNEGPGTSRNNGILAATGKYIVFMDSDDFFSNDFLKTVQPLLEKDIDCIVFDALIYHSEVKKFKLPMFITDHKQGSIDVKDAIVYMRGSTWGKIYKRKILTENTVQFLPQKRSEDVPFTKHAISCCKSIIYIKKPMYMYVQQKDSLMHNPSLTNPQNAERAFFYMQKHLKTTFPEEIEALFIKEYLFPVALQRLSIHGKVDTSNFIDNAILLYPNCLYNRYHRSAPVYIRALVWIVVKKKLLVLTLFLYIKRLRSGFLYRAR